MKKRKFIVPVALLILVIGALIWSASGEREPTYEGKSLTQWLDQYASNWQIFYANPPSNYLAEEAGRRLARAAAETAVKHIGTNALPYLTKMVSVNDSSLKQKVLNLLSKQSLVPIHVRSAMHYHRMAVSGFEILRADAAPEIPHLIKLLDIKTPDMDVETAQTAANCLVDIGPLAIPDLLPVLIGTNEGARSFAAGALHRLVPRISYLLGKDENETNRWQMAVYLGQIGIRGLDASEALTNALNDKSLLVRSAATNTLKTIDAEAAAKLGIKRKMEIGYYCRFWP